MTLDMVGRLHEQADDARTDGSHADNTDPHWLVHRIARRCGAISGRNVLPGS
jgi:hypothetical protein